jgi:hypothetical protein
MDGRNLFQYQYSDGETNCEFLDFKFRAGHGRIVIGDDIYLCDPEESPGVLIVVDRETAEVTTQDLKPESERVYLRGSEEPIFQTYGSTAPAVRSRSRHRAISPNSRSPARRSAEARPGCQTCATGT